MWVLFYSNYESCACSYGVSAVTGCEASSCDTTGGSTVDWDEACYMAVITMTTVGFGDFSPKTEAGRVFGLFWMFFGVLMTGNFVTAIGGVIDEARKAHALTFRISHRLFRQLDQTPPHQFWYAAPA